ncbi:MAG: hypothetical protein ACTHOE_08710 [Conexibacter sp.]
MDGSCARASADPGCALILRRLPTLATVIATFLVAVPWPATAFANGDPPSEYLGRQDVYVPRGFPPSRTSEVALEQIVKQAHAAGYPLKVAVVAGDYDLGNVPFFLDRPGDYAQHLTTELYPTGKVKPILVVAPSGFGVYPASAKAKKAIHVSPPRPDAEGLTRAAIEAVGQLARAEGYAVQAQSRSGSGSTVLVVSIALIGVAAVGTAVWLRRRRSVDDDAAG